MLGVGNLSAENMTAKILCYVELHTRYGSSIDRCASQYVTRKTGQQVLQPMHTRVDSENGVYRLQAEAAGDLAPLG